MFEDREIRKSQRKFRERESEGEKPGGSPMFRETGSGGRAAAIMLLFFFFYQ
jgi:hypothetical protein